MKKLLTAIIMIAFISVKPFAQTESFSPGWYIIQHGAQYAILLPSGEDFYWDDYNSQIQYPEVSTLYMAVNEAVLAFAFSKNKYYCFDPNGRIIVFKGVASLSQAPASQTGVIHLNETITLPGGEDELHDNGYYWCASEDEESFTIQLAENKTYKVKKGKTSESLNKVEYHTGGLKKYSQSEIYKVVEE